MTVAVAARPTFQDGLVFQNKPVFQPAPSGYRREVQGLRALAVVMVVVYHIWFGRVSGGVDVFLLISAMLLTGSFMRKAQAGTPLQLRRYWTDTFKRLLPMAAVVIIGTLWASYLLLPPRRWRELILEAVAAGTYWENIVLAARSVDYYASDQSLASPLQHFWSLSIQGQVFVLWPLLFAAALLLSRRLPVKAPVVVGSVLGLMTVVSFGLSVYLTRADQSRAYFDTWTRLWEFGLGSLLALALPSIERRWRDPRVRAFGTWVGIILILTAGWVIDVDGAFPGYAALWPLVGAGLIVAAGSTGVPWGGDRLLRARPLQWLGGISYALYLVHWPILVFVRQTQGGDQLSVGLGALLIVASIVIAWLLTTLVDRPIRTSQRLRSSWRGVVVIVISIGLIAASSTAWTLSLDNAARRLLAQAAANNPGAQALTPGFRYFGEPNPALLPAPDRLDSDWFTLPESCERFEVPRSVARYCSFAGDGTGPLLVVAGDSRDEQFAPALMTSAQARGWDVMLIVRGGCAFTAGRYGQAGCLGYNSALARWIAAISPEAFASSATLLMPDDPDAKESDEGIAELHTMLLAAGIDVIGYRTAPRLPRDPLECYESDGDRCRITVATQFADRSSNQLDSGRAERSLPAVPGPGRSPRTGGAYYSIDVLDKVCPNLVCVPVIGNIYVWMDAAHISATYARTLSAAVSAQLTEQGWTWG